MVVLVRVCVVVGVFLVQASCAGSDESGATLRDTAVGAEVSIGSASQDELLAGDEDLEYRVVLAREFDSLTPFKSMKWGRIHPEPDRYEFAEADATVEFAEANRMRVRGHTLVWGSAIDPPNPEYLESMSSPEALRALMADHIQSVMTRYRGRVDRWDVVNEPLAKNEVNDTDGLQDSAFLELLGPGYIAEALELAHAADPDARLFINDAAVMKPGWKQDRYYRLVQELVDANVPLHGVGFQTHLYFLPGGSGGDPTEEQMTATLRRFAALGVDVEITELNVHTWRFEGDRTARLERQSEEYAAAVRACLSVPECKAVTVWLFTDRYPTTVESILGLDGEPLLFDENYVPKPAYFGVLGELQAGRP